MAMLRPSWKFELSRRSGGLEKGAKSRAPFEFADIASMHLAFGIAKAWGNKTGVPAFVRGGPVNLFYDSGTGRDFCVPQ